MIDRFSPDLDEATLRAALDRIIPADDFPGAWDAGVGVYIARQLAGDLMGLAPLIAEGLALIDQEAQLTYGLQFAALSVPRQDVLLARIETGEVWADWRISATAFFTLLVRLANEGYYGDPGNGGNRGEVAWRMLGYETRRSAERDTWAGGEPDEEMRHRLKEQDAFAVDPTTSEAGPS